MKNKPIKRWLQIGLAVVLAITFLLGGCMSDLASDAILDTNDYYVTNLFSWNGTAWVDTALGGGGGGGLWQVAGGDTELIIADSLDIQSQFIHNVLDPVLNQDAATKSYVDTADTVLANDIATNATAIATNAAAIAVNVGNIATNFANIATNTADIASNASAIATNAADIASNATVIATNTANIATNTADIASNATALSTHVADNSSHTTTTTAAVTLYVDAGAGDDGNDGTSGSPKATIQGALDALPVVIAHECTINVRGPQNYAESNTELEFGRFDTLDYIVIKTVNSNDEDMYDNGQADAGAGNNELDDATKSWSVDQFNGAYVWIYEGTGAGQIRTISDTTATKLTISVNWAVNPDATSYYAIGGGATLTGTDSYHIRNDGKKVKVYGFRHTGATVYDVSFINAAFGHVYYNYCQTSVYGMGCSSGSIAYFYYNYNVASTAGAFVNGGQCFPRGSVFTGSTRGVYVLYNGQAVMASTGLKNYIDNCTTGIDIVLGGSCVSANVQVFNGCATDIDPWPSTTVPRWWT